MFSCYKADIARVVCYLKDKNLKDVKIYNEDTHEFIATFFACLALNLKPIVLTTKDKDALNLDFKLISKCEICEFSIDENAQFYLKTSGSSGVAKTIKKQFSQMIAEAKFLAENFTFGDEFLASVSHQHMFGLTFKIFLPLVLNRPVNKDFLNYPEFIYALNLKNKTLISSPTILKALLKSDKKELLCELKNIICAGGMLTNDVERELRGLSKLINIYGSTETGVVAADIGDGFAALSAVKYDTDARQTLNVSSPWCEFFQTNDTVKIQNGKLKLLGRVDRVVKINEKRIGLDMLELRLKEHELVENAICGTNDNNTRISVVFSLSKSGKVKFRQDGKKGVTTALKEYLKDEYGALIRHFKVVSNINTNAQGKIAKSEFSRLINLKESLEFKIIKKDENEAIFYADINFGLFYFAGHFMDFPVLPGFVQLNAIYELSSYLGVTKSALKKIQAIKFQGLVRPGDKVDLRMWIKNQKLYFELKNQDKICSNGRICIN